MRTRYRPYVLQAVLLVLALVPMFPNVFFRGEVLVPMSHMYESAPWSVHRPPNFPEQNPLGSEVTIAVCMWYKLTNVAFDRHEVPLWNPLEFMGMPLIGNFQSAVFYPPRLLFRIFQDTYVGMTAYILLRFWLCGFNAYVVGRIFGLRAPFASLYSFLFMYAGYNQLWTFYPPPDVMAWLPLLLAGFESLLRARFVLGTALTMGSITMAILAAHPSTVMLGCTGVALYTIARLIVARAGLRHAWKCVACAAGAFAVGITICAIQLIPFAETMSEMLIFINRTVPEGVRHFAYSGYDLLALFGSRMLGTQLEHNFWGSTNHTYVGMLYVGIVTWVCLSLLTSRETLRRAGRTRVIALLAVSSVCLYCATTFPLADLVQSLPLIRSNRPAYFFAFPAMAFPLCASLSLQAWIDGKPSLRGVFTPAVVVGVSALILGAAVAAAPYLSFAYMEQVQNGAALSAHMLVQWRNAVLIAFSAIAFLALYTQFPRYTKVCVAALCLIATADMSIAMRGVMATTPRAYVVPQTKVTDFLQSIPKPFRVRLDTADIRPGYAPLYGIEQYGGHDAVYPKRVKPYLDDFDISPGTTGDAILSCEYALFPEDAKIPEKYDVVMKAEGVAVAKSHVALPRARLVGALRTFATTDALIDAMKQPDFDPHAVVYVDTPLDFTLPAPDGLSPGDARIEDWQNEYVKVSANATKECVLVLADGYAPGWEARVDGKSENVFPAYYLYRGVHLAPGKHTIEFRYNPRGYRIGQMISFAGLTLACIGAFTLLRIHP